MRIARSVLATAVFFSLVFSSAARGQGQTQSRAERLRQKREEKKAALKPFHPTTIERVLLQLEEGNPTGFNYKGFYPDLFTQLGTGSGFAPRLRYYKPRFLDSPLDFQGSAQASLKGYQQHEVLLGRIQSRRGLLFMPQKTYQRLELKGQPAGDERRFFAYGTFRYRNFPQEDFYGLGSDSSPDLRATFTLEDTALDGVMGYERRWLAAGVRAGLLWTETTGGTDDRFPTTEEVFDESTAPGISAGPLHYFRVESALQLDFRDTPGNPHRGGVLTLTFARYDDRSLNLYGFDRVAADARGFLPLGSPQRVLALRAYASSDDPAAGNEVPFYLLDYLGGSHSLRSFKRNRFMDQNLLALSAEYRWEPLPFVELALFYDAGKAFSDPSDFNLNNLRESYGVGARFKSYKAVGFRVDVAWGDEGTRLYLKFNQVF